MGEKMKKSCLQDIIRENNLKKAAKKRFHKKKEAEMRHTRPN